MGLAPINFTTKDLSDSMGIAGSRVSDFVKEVLRYR